MAVKTSTPPADARPDVRVQLANVFLSTTGDRADLARAVPETLAALRDVRPGGAR